MKTWIWTAAALLWMAFIWRHSSIPASDQDVRPWLQDWMTLTDRSLPKMSFWYGDFFITSEQPYDLISFFVRKMGHVAEFAVLAVLVCSALYSAGLRGLRIYVFAGIITMGYACIDEWHQSTVPGRTGTWRDVAFPDALGTLLGLALMRLRMSRFARRSEPVR